MLTRNHLDQERMQQLCSLAVLGEISFEDRIILKQHLKVCAECRSLMKDLEQIVLFDLSAAAAVQMENQVRQDLEPVKVDDLLARVLERAKRGNTGVQGLNTDPSIFVPACPVPILKRAKTFLWRAYPFAGWAVAALLLFIWGYALKASNPSAAPGAVRANASGLVSQVEMNDWKMRAESAEEQSADFRRDMERAQAHAQVASQALAKAKDETLSLQSSLQALQAQLAEQDAKLRQQAATLNVAEKSLDEERSNEADLRAQLSEVNAKLDQQRTESAHLRKVAASVTPRTPATGDDSADADARDLLGARDLHIVDVYDIDHAGRVSRTYGRVYYVNHSLLLFYAFDLDQSAKGRKPVAFQAWGFRRSDSKTAESLGLFYLEDPKVDRWTLRVTDVSLLSRIDTLFVTVESPGGNTVPKGRQILFASLVGPPNHP